LCTQRPGKGLNVAANYDDVFNQLTAAGLIISGALQVGRRGRVRVEGGGREQRGWYRLHEIQGRSGEPLLIGSFGIWRGNDQGTMKVKLRKTEFDAEQLASIKRRLAEDRKREALERKKSQEQAARRAQAAWARLAIEGESPYLDAKGVGGHGLRYTEAGTAVLPICDAAGVVQGLQFLRTAKQAETAKRPAKEFWPAGLAKKGNFHILGVPGEILCVAEGYATAATIHEATGLAVACAFDAGNLAPVCAVLRKRYRQTRILICADDDSLAACTHCSTRFSVSEHPTDCPSCAKPHGRMNAGITAASSAALEVGGHWVAPTWPDPAHRLERYRSSGSKPTDFNDLSQLTTAATVRHQVQEAIAGKGWTVGQRPAPRVDTSGGKGEALRTLDDLDHMLGRYALIYGQGGVVFDRAEHRMVALGDMRDLCQRRELHRAWMEHPARQVVRVDNVGFDPAGDDPDITCNLWSGWPTEPRAGDCTRLLELLRYMCSKDSNPEYLYRWVLRWIAYPIQHPGAKMKTTLVVHGPQGAGKNMFFEVLMGIYGRYGRVIGQTDVEDKFNDWASRKLFLIADEVVARSDLYHIKNKLKSFITGDWIRINPKGFAAYDERNHVNVVFLSNEAMPVVLEEDDRRHAVIWTPEKLGPGYYAAVMAEIANGGAAALHDYLLNLPLVDFTPGTLPPITAAKAELIELSRDSTSRFVYELLAGNIPPLSARPAISLDVYEAYRLWCHRTGNRPAPIQKLSSAMARHHGIQTVRKRYRVDVAAKPAQAMVTFLASGRTPPFDDPERYGTVDRRTQHPPDENEQDWIGAHVRRFQVDLADYRQVEK
jgi:putative DNA primase/helicase